MGHITVLPTHVAMKYSRSNMADKWQKRCFLKNVNHELWAVGRSCQKFCDCSKKLHIKDFMVGHSADLPTHVARKYGRSDMADNRKSGAFWNFNHKLWAIYRSCQNPVTAV